VRILSTPQILTTDNQEAKIYVGQNVPFQTKSTTTENDTFNSFEYRDVGRTLKITPSISIDRMVRLEISLESTDLQSTTDFRPTTLKRTVDTTAIVKDRNTVVLGGLIDNTSSSTVYKIPCLGDIPGIGYLFSNRAETRSKTNLYVFLTPKVIQNSAESRKIYNTKRKEIEELQEENIKLYNQREPAVELPEDNRIEKFEYKEDPSPDDSMSPQSSLPAQTPPQTEAAAAVPAATGNTESQQEPGADAKLSQAPDSSISSDTEAAAQQSPADPLTNEAALQQPVTPSAGAVESTSQSDAASIPAPTSTKGFTVQVASVQSAQQADQILKRLTSLGYAAYTVQSTVEGVPWYRLRIGYYNQRDDAQAIMSRLQADNYDPFLIKF